MDYKWLRRQMLAAVAADDGLFELLVLKGGNALSLALGVGDRASLDLDYSLEGDLESLEETGHRLENAIGNWLEREADLVLFGFTFVRKPRAETELLGGQWGGYEARFKLIDKKRFGELGCDPEAASREALPIGSSTQRRSFVIQISKHEHCEGAIEVVIEGIPARSYSPAMIAAEKLRSICQQMDEYPHNSGRTERARDFLDIYGAVTEEGVNLASTENRELIRAMFAAKEVDLDSLSRIEDYRELHEGGWDAVRDTAPPDTEGFEFYFSFILEQVRRIRVL